ncbi:MAG: polysaccharide deacetylase family protein [Polyangiaceae bacterium]|nr:polysaccharide deacetylase family protein [Polyangiaceae bacterium]
MTANAALLALSVDLDDLELYRAIHGLPSDEEAARARFSVSPAYVTGVRRALAFARERGVPLTFFCVARDLEDPSVQGALAGAIAEGHTVESHSQTHPYDLSRRSPNELDREIGGSFDAIERALGVRPTGFRAPGYIVDDPVFDALERAGAAFDSSVMPCPPYYFAKLAVLGAMQMIGRRSKSIVGGASVLVAPTEPYRPGSPYFRRGSRPLVELPIQVTRGPRLPVIGTSLGRAGERGARALVRACGATPLLNLELHLIDFLDRSDVPIELADLPELRTPLARRLAAFGAAIDAALGRRAVTLAEAARSVA